MQNILVSHFIFSLCNEGFGANKPFEIRKHRFTCYILKGCNYFSFFKVFKCPELHFNGICSRIFSFIKFLFIDGAPSYKNRSLDGVTYPEWKRTRIFYWWKRKQSIILDQLRHIAQTEWLLSSKPRDAIY